MSLLQCQCDYCTGRRASVTTERNALRAELAQTVARNIELERRRVSLEAEVDRLDALWRHSERTLSEERLPAPAQESDSPFILPSETNDTKTP